MKITNQNKHNIILESCKYWSIKNCSEQVQIFRNTMGITCNTFGGNHFRPDTASEPPSYLLKADYNVRDRPEIISFPF